MGVYPNAAQHTLAVVVPAWQLEHLVRGAIESVLGQTHDRLVLVVVDDGSSDATYAAALEAAASDRRCRVVRKATNSGVGPTRNVGIDESEKLSLEVFGELPFAFVFLDADDRLHPEAAEVALTALISEPPSTAGVIWTFRSVAMGREVDYTTYGGKSGRLKSISALAAADLPVTASSWLMRRSAIGPIRFRSGLSEDVRFVYEVMAAQSSRAMLVIEDVLSDKGMRIDSLAADRALIHRALYSLRRDFRAHFTSSELADLLTRSARHTAEQCPALTPFLLSVAEQLKANPTAPLPRLPTNSGPHLGTR